MDIFAQSQETYDEAKKKSSEENGGNRAKFFRFDKDGQYSLRILPLAPMIDADGKAVFPMERKGYEYPVKELLLQINTVSKDGKSKDTYVSVCNAKHAFPKLESDLIDMYVKRACELHSVDEALCKKLKESSFNGGLKWDSKRCMYVLDHKNRTDGMQIVRLSYPQYKELEEDKLSTWEKLTSGGQKANCPISAVVDAFVVEVRRKTENRKTSYTFKVDSITPKDTLSGEELKALLDAPRLPEAIYRYTRFHLEATIAYLKQYDEKMGINVMGDEKVLNCIEQIKIMLPADDNSHFKMGESDSASSGKSLTIDDLWDIYDNMKDTDDRSEEGQELRASIKEFIDDNDLGVRIARSKTNKDLLEEIEAVLKEESKGKEETPMKKEELEGEPERLMEEEEEKDEEERLTERERRGPRPVRR